VPLTQHDNVIQALSAYGSDESLHERILPGAVVSSSDFFDAKAGNAILKCLAVDQIVVAQQVFQRVVIWKCIDNLLCSPAGARVLGNVEVQNFSAIMTNDDKAIEYAKSCCQKREKITGHDLMGVFLEKCLPSV